MVWTPIPPPAFCVLAHSDSDKLLVQDDPRQQVDEGHVGREEGHDLGAALESIR
jgi:hypothetical protein